MLGGMEGVLKGVGGLLEGLEMVLEGLEGLLEELWGILECLGESWRVLGVLEALPRIPGRIWGVSVRILGSRVGSPAPSHAEPPPGGAGLPGRFVL